MIQTRLKVRRLVVHLCSGVSMRTRCYATESSLIFCFSGTWMRKLWYLRWNDCINFPVTVIKLV